MKILIVEDDVEKYGKIVIALTDSGVNECDIDHAVCATQASDLLSSYRYELMLLDINIPRRLGEAAKRGEGLEILRQLDRDDSLIKPRYIVGITAFEDLITEFGDFFYENLWTIVHYNPRSDLWLSQLKGKVSYIRSADTSRQFSDGVTFGVDIALLCALDSVELDAVRELDLGWQPLRLPHDDTRYFMGSLTTGRETLSVLAAAAPRMGMTATAVLTSKVIQQFRPRAMSLVGICAGRFGKVELGDVVVASPTWDYGAGKIASVKNKATFLPSPHHLNADTRMISIAKDLADDHALLASIRRGARGNKPKTALTLHVGPMACGAAVVAHGPTFNALLTQHRGVLALEMESYGAADAIEGSSNPRPILIVAKAVCDFADKDKEDDFQEYAANVSAMIGLELAKRVL